MISVRVEKEIRTENRVIGKLTFRQAICFLIVIVITIGAYYIIRPNDFTDMVPIALTLGVIAWYFGFHKKSGIYMEYFFLKKIKDIYLMNHSRRYRTKNAYYKLLNEGSGKAGKVKCKKRMKRGKSKIHGYK